MVADDRRHAAWGRPSSDFCGVSGQVSGESGERKPIPQESQEVLQPPGRGSREALTAPHNV